MKKISNLNNLLPLYPMLKKHMNIRISKGRCIVYNGRTEDATLESCQNIVLLSLCNGRHTLAEITEIYKAVFSTSTAAAKEQAEAVLKSYTEAIKYYETQQPERHIFDLSLLKNTATWKYSVLRDEYLGKLTIVLTECCNHICDYCFKSCDNSKKQEMEPDDWLRVIDEAHALGVQEITFTGGEPFLYKDFISLIAHCTSKGIYTKISTNGTLLNEDMITRLKNAGAEFIHLSLPSVSEDIYDKITGSTQHLQKVIRAVRQLKKNNFYIRVKMVLTPHNTKEVGRLIDFCAEENIDFVHLAPYILTENSRLGRQLIPDEAELIRLNSLADQKRKIHKNIVISDIPIGSLKWGGPECIAKCGGIKDSLTILANGDITLCEAVGELKEFILGNIKKDTLTDIWNSSKPDDITCPDGKNIDAACSSCEYLDRCLTGCYAFSHMQSGNAWSMDPRCFRFCDTHNIFSD